MTEKKENEKKKTKTQIMKKKKFLADFYLVEAFLEST